MDYITIRPCSNGEWQVGYKGYHEHNLSKKVAFKDLFSLIKERIPGVQGKIIKTGVSCGDYLTGWYAECRPYIAFDKTKEDAIQSLQDLCILANVECPEEIE